MTSTSVTLSSLRLPLTNSGLSRGRAFSNPGLIALQDLDLHLLKILFEYPPVIPKPKAVVVAGRVEPGAPCLLGISQHFERIFEKVVPQVHIMDMQAIGLGQCGQGAGQAVHILQVFIDRTADNQVNGLKFSRKMHLAHIRLQQGHMLGPRSRPSIIQEKVLIVFWKQPAVMGIIRWRIFITEHHMARPGFEQTYPHIKAPPVSENEDAFAFTEALRARSTSTYRLTAVSGSLVSTPGRMTRECSRRKRVMRSGKRCRITRGTR